MTKVEIIKQNDYITEIIISGHALGGKYGHDVVCAGISTVVTGICNALTELVSFNEANITFEEGYVKIAHLTNAENVQLIINVLIVQLQTIENVYPKYIEVSYL